MGDTLPRYAAEGAIAADLAGWAAGHGYEGPLGIDAYLYRDPGGEIALRPFCEINPRYTMGRVALELRRQIAPGCNLLFEIIKAAHATDGDDAPEFDANGRWCGGSLLLTERRPETHFVVRVTPGRTLPRPAEPLS